jgi:hypothetical protein
MLGSLLEAELKDSLRRCLEGLRVGQGEEGQAGVTR